MNKSPFSACEVKGWSYDRINREIFGGRYSGRQSISWIVRRAKGKLLIRERQRQWQDPSAHIA
jgi:hypothetical protein